ncbi:DUF4270 domain-containing protein [Flavobacterium sp. GT3R68]|uniref:DUF4270 domain-containing protein n=1 Tax=Flavobacterium sp. GT3R68 TaxID=2594437 RepID=UPI000F895B4B|nr:DUF4270 domain-containing protein [Flavobacterium sp. GT3R68]RTY90856.1 DUF4270 domain-containing protein [Flavobacterium sp. GSN2]TRW93849.1 DUF4270 domain-containing protein [Flavobacterium sp. GT3R68]
MQNTSFFKLTLVALIAVFFASCDKDYNEVGSDIIGDDHFGLVEDNTTTVVAYNQSLGAVQSNNLPINALGYYEHPVFGKTTASFLTQVGLQAANPTFGVTPTVTRVELSIPYYSTLTKTLEDGAHTYELDSVYGGYGNNFKLGVYESKYYLRDYDAATGFQEVQKYYSDQASDFTINPTRLNDDTISPTQNDEFFFSNGEIVTQEIDEHGEAKEVRSAPRMRLNLNATFFQDKIFGAGAAGKLINNNTFQEYFRGLYFKAETTSESTNPGSLAMLNFKAGKVTISYKVFVAEVPANGTTAAIPAHWDDKKLVLDLGGNTVNVFENEYNPAYVSSFTSPDKIAGDPLLYVKGQAGSMTVIELFSNTDVNQGYDANGVLIPGSNNVSDELDALRHPANGKQRLINEANLSFTIDAAKMDGSPEPNRVYLYDLDNKRPLIDYYSDNSLSANPKFNKVVHGGIIETKTVTIAGVKQKKGIRYKIRLTNHIRNLVKNDSTNVRLGLVVTEDIKTVTSGVLRNSFNVNPTPEFENPFTVDRVPLSSIINPLGTVLYGSNPSVPVNQRLKLRIYYTEPK